MILNNELQQEIFKNGNYLKLLVNGQHLFVPKKVESMLGSIKYKKELLEIHEDRLLAIEYCLVFLSNFANIQSDYNNQDKWKALATDILKVQIPGLNGSRYLKVIKFLSKPIFPLSSMIEVKKNKEKKDSYQVGKKSKEFRLINEFSNLDFVSYTIKSEFLLKKRNEQMIKSLSFNLKNPIVKNLLTVYPRLTLPTLEEIDEEAKRLSKAKYHTSKGKLLTYMYGRKKSEFLNFENRRVSNVDCLKSYKNLFDNGFLVPVISGERGGQRVCDSFNMMPSFIRNLIKIDNEIVVNVDFKCLHPNLIIKLYGGNTKYLTHKIVAEELELDLTSVKIKHLSFFNKKESSMKSSELFEYYKKNEPIMLKRIFEDKNRFTHKVTSKKTFDLEVKIMTECIKRLNQKNIYPLYIFDALLINYKNQDIVKIVMNEVVHEMGIYTTAEVK